MSLKETSDQIAENLRLKQEVLAKVRNELLEERLQAAEEYKAANTGDRSENAPLEAAIERMQKVNSKIIENEKQIHLISSIDDLSRYNSVGIVVLYSTVRIRCRGKEFVYRIFPAGISYLDIGVMAANSRVASAIMGRQVGDVIYLTHDGEGTEVEYEILEIY